MADVNPRFFLWYREFGQMSACFRPIVPIFAQKHRNLTHPETYLDPLMACAAGLYD